MSLTTEEKKTAALLASFCMYLSILEYLIPKPLPFMRLGLANLPILVSLIILPKRGTLLLIFLKIAGQGFINGTLFSYIFIFSAAGSLSSGIIMIIAFSAFRKHITMTGVSVLGALASNLVQITAARYIIFGKAALLIAPPFLVIGMISSVLLGLFAEEFILKSEWVELRKKIIPEKKEAEGK